VNKPATLAMLLALAVPGAAFAAVDCSHAKSNVDKLLCSNSRLAKADQRMALAFRQAIRRGVDPEQLMETQRNWMREQRDPCNDVECMLRAYEERISDLDNR
jgi:uncharacterized protein